MKRLSISIAALAVAGIFVQTLFFKFTYSAETRHITETLTAWAEGFGLGFAFDRYGPAGPYAGGMAELVAAVLLLLGTMRPRLRHLRALGALLALLIMSAAMTFHLATPLGVNVLGDGGLLFGLGVVCWLLAFWVLAHEFKLLTWPGKRQPAGASIDR